MGRLAPHTASHPERREQTANRPKLSKRVYLGLIGNERMPEEYWRWKIAEQFGWTLEQVDALRLEDYAEYHQVRDGIGKANSSIIRR